MKIKTLLLTTAILSMATGVAFAQSGNATTPSGSGTSSSTPTGSETSKGGGAMSAPGMTKGGAKDETKDKGVSPASPSAGVKQEK